MATELVQLAEFLKISYSQLVLLIIAQIWSFVWKGVAWWKAARKGHVVWFIAFFLVHTLGILEILYIFLFSKLKLGKTKRRRRK